MKRIQVQLNNNNNNNNNNNLAMVWIDYKKTYDMVSQSWIIDCLRMYKISGELVKFVENTTENWGVELAAE